MPHLRIAFLLLLIPFAPLHAQPPLDWQRLYGGSGYDNGYSMDRTSDGGYITLSRTTSTNGDVTGSQGWTDLWVVKLAPNGELQWQRCLGGTNGEGPGNIRSCSDGGYILIGSTASEDGDVNGPGFGASDIWVVKLTTTGDLAWQARFGGSQLDHGLHIEERPNGGYILLAVRAYDWVDLDNHGSSDYWVAWLNETGELEQSRYYGGSRTELAVGDLRVLPDGGFVAVGTTNSNDGDVSGLHPSPYEYQDDVWVFCAAADGQLLWQHCLGGAHNDVGRALDRTPDGRIAVAVHTSSSDGDVSVNLGDSDTWVALLSDSGEFLQETSLGGSGSELPYDIRFAPDGSLYVISQTSSTDGHLTEALGLHDAWVCKLTPDLELTWQKSFGGAMGDYGHELVAPPDGSLCFVGYTGSTDNGITGHSGAADLWVVKLKPGDVGVEETVGHQALRIFPNPATEELVISWDTFSPTHLEVMDHLGKLCLVERVAANQHGTRSITLEGLASGLYTLRLIGPDQSLVQRFLKE